MKKLNLLDQSTSFKVNDTGTIIPFNAFENNQPFGVTENETSVFRIKNDMGFLKAVNATSAAGGYIFQLNTKDLVGLVPGTYEIELVVTNGETNAELIFPDSGFCSFNITNSALTVTGTQIPTMSLDSFKQQLEQYVQLQTNGKLDSIKSDFETYVNSVKQGPAGPQGEPGADGKPASIVVGSTTTGEVGSSASVTNSGTSSNVILNFQIPQGSPGKAASVSVGDVNNYNPWLAYSSKGKSYGKGYLLTDGEHSDASDVYTDFFGVYPNNSYSFSFPPNLPSLTGDQCIRVIWYDSNKSALSTIESKGTTFPFVLTKMAPANSAYARVCFSVGDNSNTTGDNTPLYVSDNGPTSVTNGGSGSNASLNFSIAAGSMGLQGMQGPAGADGRQGVDGKQGPIGPTGPQGTLGDYLTGTGWLDLTPYMNTDVWTDSGWFHDSNNPLGTCRYAITQINGQPIFWFRIHSRFRDASIANTWGTKLFDIPQDAQKQYGGMEMSQYNTLYECSGTPCMYQVVGDPGKRYVQTLGTLQVHYNHNGDQVIPVPSGTCTVNMEGWFVL